MTISEYKLNTDFRSPKVNLSQGEMQSFRSFQKGETVKGYVNTSAGELLIVDNIYALPMKVLIKIKDIEIDGKPVIEKPKESIADKVKAKQRVEIPAEYRAQMDKIKNTNIVSSIVNKSRNSVNGMLIGAGVGFIAAIFLKQHKFLFAIVGATAGGFIGYKVTGEQKKGVEKPKTETKA